MCFATGCPGHFPCRIQETTTPCDKIARRRQELTVLDAERFRLNHQPDHLFMHDTQARHQREHGRLRDPPLGGYARKGVCAPPAVKARTTGWCVGITDSMSGWRQTEV